MANTIQKKIMASYKLNNLRTSLRGMFMPTGKTQVIFVFGCQRSGTSMMGRIIGLSSFVNAYGEGDLPYFNQEGEPGYLRLIQWEKVAEFLQNEKNQFILLKPLYDSQVATELLSFFPNSKAIWIYRHYLDTVDSHIKNYRNDHDGIIYTKELFCRNEPSWKNEKLPLDMGKTFDKFADKKIDSATGYALFWLARNSLYQYVKENPDMLLVNYESIIAQPVEQFAKIFAFLEVPFKEKYTGLIHARAVHKKIEFKINPEVQQLCEEMYLELQKITK